MTNDYSYHGIPDVRLDGNDQRFFSPGFGVGRPGFGYGRPGFGYGRPGFGLGFLGGLATGALLAPGPGFGYYRPYPFYPYYPPYPYRPFLYY
ncbi:hypothetical protein JCM9140_2977 [Halalkalibacter wakoensis JCM 9140]|uniref:Spore coat protein n=1 Tax=Halalkalibacter wakoensis JCM 9140 TaxID=1236970 RepID=W4Q4F8_9BACI|nr:hypothetical protein JCM9140_2977 [Halalkalibacter wakoensis JCM 9140]